MRARGDELYRPTRSASSCSTQRGTGYGGVHTMRRSREGLSLSPVSAVELHVTPNRNSLFVGTEPSQSVDEPTNPTPASIQPPSSFARRLLAVRVLIGIHRASPISWIKSMGRTTTQPVVTPPQLLLLQSNLLPPSHAAFFVRVLIGIHRGRTSYRIVYGEELAIA